MSMTGRLVVTCLIAPLLALPSTARATVAVIATVEDLARTADLVVRGKIGQPRSFWTPEGRIVTESTVESAVALKGTVAEPVRVRVPGGIVDGIGQRVDGAPRLVHGEECVLFLRRAGAVHHVVGLGQGKFEIRGGVAIPDVGRMSRLDGGHRPGERP